MEAEQLARIERLLAEIRDLQQAHFDRYKEFTGRLMESDLQSREAAAASAQASDAFVAEQLAYQDEMRRHVRSSQKNIVATSIVSAMLVILLAALLISGLLSP
ncbi:MAG TPA: hypothetical protein VGN57_05115 [Pirellulaceae bacterium]|jgi:hypothetical protein|nr:hypothetical protein [Pirellulaceae bacterium]